jgi:hypothetical protein
MLEPVQPLEAGVASSWGVRAACRPAAPLQRLCRLGMTWRISSVCTLKGIRCLAQPQPQRPGLPRPRRLQGPPRPQGPPHPRLQGLSPRSADGLSRHWVRTTIGYAPEHTLWRCWSRGDWSPASRALLYIRVVTLGILAVVPVRRGRRRRARYLGGGLHIDRWGCDDDRWWVVRIGLPVGPPVWSQGDDDAGAKEDMPAAVCIPWHRARHEQRSHDPEDRQPLPACSSCLVLVVHSTSLFTSYVQVL